MQGAVLVIGSLLWENEKNTLDQKQGKLRDNWRKNLDLEKKVAIEVPIRYGRKSTSKRCTYTMVISNSVTNLGTAYIIPFRKEIEYFEELKNQALELSEAEGISTTIYPKRLIASWGAVGITFNETEEKQFEEIKNKWHEEFTSFKNTGYKIGKEQPSILENGELNFEFKVPEDIDYVFATPVKPNISEYPTTERIVEAIIESSPRYDTYVKENFNNGIRVHGDEEIMKKI